MRRLWRRRTRGWRGDNSCDEEDDDDYDDDDDDDNDDNEERVQVCPEEQSEEAAISSSRAKRRPGGQDKGDLRLLLVLVLCPSRYVLVVQVRAMVSEPLQKTFLREKSELALREKEQVVDKVEGSRRVTTVISPGREVMDFTKVLEFLVLLVVVTCSPFSGEEGDTSGEEGVWWQRE